MNLKDAKYLSMTVFNPVKGKYSTVTREIYSTDDVPTTLCGMYGQAEHYFQRQNDEDAIRPPAQD
jgi:hypothetical protein